jgi:hypothetical protein
LDSGWEAEFCRVAESHPKVKAYAKNHNLGLEVPYRHGSEVRTYLPDFIVLVDDGHGDDDRLHLIVEIKGYQREDVREKKTTIETSWVPGVNNLGTYGRWAFAQFTDGYQIESVFKASVESEFDKMIADVEQTVSLLPTQKYSISEVPGRPIKHDSLSLQRALHPKPAAHPTSGRGSRAHKHRTTTARGSGDRLGRARLKKISR